MAEPEGPGVGLLFEDSADGTDAGPLPAPGRDRFQPLRAGILNLWQYDRQVFRFEDGHLLLRGDNGSGKSKALELLLPFLLDADLSPHRLDPFASTARRMEWNLLEGDLHPSRLGYVWLELGQLEEDGRERTLTLGCGLRATRGTGRVDVWYFHTSLRVGRELALVEGNAALSREQLRQALGDRGTVYEAGREYRERVDGLLFGLGRDRFDALRELLLQLRRPHLSEKLDPPGLSQLLGNSLPPLDADLIGQISEGYERLEHDQAELARIEAAARAVEEFLSVYADYAKGVARGRAEEVRKADSQFHKVAAEFRAAEAEEASLAGRLSDFAERGRLAEARGSRLEGRVRGLEQSEAMRQAVALHEKRERAADLARRAEQDRGDRERERIALEKARGEGDEARIEADRAGARSAAAGEQAAGEARAVGLEAAHVAAAEALSERPEAARATHQAAVDKRGREVEELETLRRGREEARTRFEQAEGRRQDADAQAREAAGRTEQARGEAARCRDELLRALGAWAETLEELRLAPEELASLTAAVLEMAGPEGDLVPSLMRLAAPRRDRLVELRIALEAHEAAVAAERAEVAALRERVAAARELGPEAPRTRQSQREGRAGAPLYLLCDFAPGLEAEARAELEAALEAAGLLDAWVSPEGHLLAAGTLDTVLTPAPLASGETLADWLTPAPGHGIDRSSIDALLRSVAVADAGAPAPHRVGLDGSWRLGPLSGAWTKEVAEHVGAGAREAARQRRLAELAAHLDVLEAQLEALAAERVALTRRLARLTEEGERAPSPSPLGRALSQHEAAAQEEGRRRTELAEAEAVAARAREARAAAEERLDRRARELGLAAMVEDLGGYRRRLEEYRRAFADYHHAHAAATGAARRARQAEARLEVAAEREAEVRERARASARHAEQVHAEWEALEHTVGAEAAEILRQLAEAQGELAREEQELERLRREERQVAEERAGVRERLRMLEQTQTERDLERGKAVFRLQRLGQSGLLELFYSALPEEAPATWTLTRCLDLARGLEASTADVELSEAAANRRANRMHGRYQTLVAELGTELEPSLAQEEDLQVVRVMHNNQELSVLALSRVLVAEVDRRRSLLLEQERELLRRFLLGEVGDHLRKRLRQAEELVGETNTLLAGVATASGLTLRLAWRPSEEEAPAVREAVRLLRQDPELLADSDRRALEGFFQARIQTAREDSQAVPWREHLVRALDYRRWHSFKIQRRESRDGPWRDLTRQSHAASSGGEKAVALHLPLFAAAAAHYRSALPTAPRLILLDEAFAGIDEGMRGRCMALLVQFDLDFMMTSHDEWGCYEELPGCATYQLYRDPDFRGVAAIRFVWNGRQLVEEAPS